MKINQQFDITKGDRALANGHRPLCFWFTGLSGSGKSTIANAFEKKLHANGIKTYVLDGDNLRQGLNSSLGFDLESRIENIRRTAEVAKLMVDAGLVVLVTLISPLKISRDSARALFGPDEFVEVYINTPLDICEARDPKGIYKKARQGKILDFTGIDSPYDIPINPDVVLDASKNNLDEIVMTLLNLTDFKLTKS
ncbi:adenylyl-sulfate kinase [Polynucleobacter asymbioticus]|uniref:adenylyl-sulfate kinase n=1 Tax=Polynucleobacter asymbioticus TaxID=576611 RepID=UPI0008F7F6DD|nr:adenylyl-sulfate kinase [Polynucleobacter asymbioticus]